MTASILENSALFFPDRPAIRENETEIGYAGLYRLAGRVADGLVKPGMGKGLNNIRFDFIS